MPCNSQLQPTAGSTVCLPQALGLESEQEKGHAAPLRALSRGGSDTADRGQHVDLAAGRAQQKEENALVWAAVTPHFSQRPEAVDQKHQRWPTYPGDQGTMASTSTPYDSAHAPKPDTGCLEAAAARSMQPGGLAAVQAGYGTVQAQCGTVQPDCSTAQPMITSCSMPLPSLAGSAWHSGQTSVSMLRDACHGCVMAHDDS